MPMKDKEIFTEADQIKITRAAQDAGAGGLDSTSFWREFEEEMDRVADAKSRSGLVQPKSLIDK